MKCEQQMIDMVPLCGKCDYLMAWTNEELSSKGINCGCKCHDENYIESI